MTTIAYDGITLASDSKVTMYDTDRGPTEKLCRLKDGRLMGFAGQLVCREPFIEYLNGDKTEAPKGDYGAVIINLDGTVRMYEDGKGGYAASAPCARGSGSVAAMAAMLCGKTAEQAVKIAIKLDVYSGGRVQSLRLKSKT